MSTHRLEHGSHAAHAAAAAPVSSRREHRAYALSTVLTLVYAIVEMVGGFWTGSLALLSDAGHMFFDVLALSVAWAASGLAQRPPTSRHSFGLVRVEVLGGLLNGVLMLMVILLIALAAVDRLRAPVAIDGFWTLLIAGAGLAVNLAVISLLSRARRTLNARGALLHVVGDLLGSLAAIAAGVIVLTTGWLPVDPLLSVVIAALILVSTLRLLRHATHVLLEGVPEWIDLARLREDLSAQPGVDAVVDCRAWVLGSGHAALTARIAIAPDAEWEEILARVQTLLVTRYAIDHITVQPVVAVPSPRGH